MQKNENRPGYKQTKVGWIPIDWTTSTLGGSSHFLTSGSRGWSRYYSPEGDLFVRITNLKRKSIQLNYSNCRFVDLPVNGSEGTRTRLQPGDILISITADLGIVAYYSLEEPYQRAFVNQHVALLRLLDENILSKFVAYLLSSAFSQRRFLQITDQGAKTGLNLSAINSFTVIFPSYPEQKAIAQVLECWDKTIRAYEQKIRNGERAKQGLIQKSFSEVTMVLKANGNRVSTQLSQFGRFTKGKGISRSQVVDAGLPCIRYGEIYTSDDFVKLQLPSLITAQTASESTPIACNDLLFAGSGESIDEIGKSVAYMGEEKGYAGGDIVIFTPDKNQARSDFLSYYLNTYGRRELNWLGQGQSVVHIYAKDLGKIPVPLPNLKTQEKYVKLLNDSDKRIKVLRTKLELLTRQKKFLLNNLVTGTIRLPQFIHQSKAFSQEESVT